MSHRPATSPARGAGYARPADCASRTKCRPGSAAPASFWGFEQQGVVPDIVTLGKPMGNGHPLAVVVTTPAIARAFATNRSYFNTFGGNPVSCAAGLAVLDVLEREGLQDNARDTGRYLGRALETLAAKHELVGDLRGSGLFWGVELVRDRATREPAAEAAHAVVNGLRQNGVLVGRTGLHSNVLKSGRRWCFPEPMSISWSQRWTPNSSRAA